MIGRSLRESSNYKIKISTIQILANPTNRNKFQQGLSLMY